MLLHKAFSWMFSGRDTVGIPWKDTGLRILLGSLIVSFTGVCKKVFEHLSDKF